MKYGSFIISLFLLLLVGCASSPYHTSSSEYFRRESRTPDSLPSPQVGYFNWPLNGYVSSGYGRRHGRFHEGIDIPARKGTIVKAARSGRVIYAGNRIRGYGNVVVIKHNDDYSTVYAHLSKMDVRGGQFINRGQWIGRVGRTGHATSPHLHFEIRIGHYPVNPLLFLQAQYASH